MMVKVRVFGYLKKYCSRETSKPFECALSEHATGRDLVALLGLPAEEDLILVVNNVNAQDKEILLHEHDEVSIYPYLGGG
jgi:molybdopterin converting factor small subunit